MRILLDESVPRPFGREPWASGEDVLTVAQMGWASTRNGELLRRAADAGFDALLTSDRNLEYQQSIRGLDICVIVLVTPSNRLEDLQPLGAELESKLARASRGDVIREGTETWMRPKRRR